MMGRAVLARARSRRERRGGERAKRTGEARPASDRDVAFPVIIFFFFWRAHAHKIHAAAVVHVVMSSSGEKRKTSCEPARKPFAAPVSDSREPVKTIRPRQRGAREQPIRSVRERNVAPGPRPSLSGALRPLSSRIPGPNARAGRRRILPVHQRTPAGDAWFSCARTCTANVRVSSSSSAPDTPPTP